MRILWLGVFVTICASLRAEEVAQKFDRLSTFGVAKPLSEKAVTGDWPHFLGSNYDLLSVESGLMRNWDEENLPRLLWTVERGKGYAPPVASEGKIVMAHRLDGQETVECLDAETGQRFWVQQYPIDFGEAFGYPEAPMAPPTIDGDHVYLMGTRAKMRCYSLNSGDIVWERDFGKEMAVETHFFGKGGAPLVYGDQVILNLGGSKNYSVASFDKLTGETLWFTEHEWDGSYSSPMPSRLHGENRILVFAGGKSNPPHGGLLGVDPENGHLDFAFPWRATREASVNGMSPRALGNRVFISEAYTEGGVLLDIREDGTPEVAVELPKLNVQFMTPIIRENRYLYGITERTDITAVLFCLDLKTGEELWRDLNIGRGNLLQTAEGVYATGEFGQFMSLELSPAGVKVLSKMQPFHAPETFTPPTIHRGLLYLVQSNKEPGKDGQPARILCFDLRS